MPPDAPAGRGNFSASGPRGWDTVAEKIARGYRNDRRSERRWRIFFRFAWLLLAAMLILGLATARNHAAVGSCLHFALTGVRGEIAEGAEASAESMLPGLKSAFQDPGALGPGYQAQLARRQPGAGRHVQRRDRAAEGAAPQEGLRGGRGIVCVGRLLHRGCG